LESHAPRALHLEEERLDRVVDPEQLLAGHWGGAARNLRACVVGHHALAIDPPSKPHAAKVGISRGQVDRQQIVRGTVEGVYEGTRLGPAAAQKRLVIPGDQAVERSVRIGEPPGNEMLLEEAARHLVGGSTKIHRLRASAAPALTKAQGLARGE